MSGEIKWRTLIGMTIANDRSAFLRSMRAIREFRPDPIPNAIIDDILEVARWTGSAMNSQPWQIIVVRDRNALQNMANANGYVKHLATAAVGIVVVMEGAGHDFDEGRLAERICLAAAAHGVGAGIGWFSGDGPNAVKALLGIPANDEVRTAIALGYPSEQALKIRTKPGEARKQLSKIVHNERFGSQ